MTSGPGSPSSRHPNITEVGTNVNAALWPPIAHGLDYYDSTIDHAVETSKRLERARNVDLDLMPSTTDVRNLGVNVDLYALCMGGRASRLDAYYIRMTRGRARAKVYPVACDRWSKGRIRVEEV